MVAGAARHFQFGVLPVVYRPENVFPAVDWARAHRGYIRQELFKHGGLLFRGFDLPTVDAFEQFVGEIGGGLLEYKERSSPRLRVGGRVYTSTEYPADQQIFLHNENSYQRTFPKVIGFYCVTPAAKGGETPLADVRNVYQKIPSSIREKFERKRVMYVRNFGEGMGLSWQDVFQTKDRAEAIR